MNDVLNTIDADLAPHPWRPEDDNSERPGYLSIVDATGNRVCDLLDEPVERSALPIVRLAGR